MHAIILAAGGVKKLPGHDAKFNTSLEWSIHAYKENGITQISVIGGKEIEKLANQFPSVRFYYNPQWKQTHTLASLYLAKEELVDADCIVSYVDTVFRPRLIKKLIKERKGDISIMIDTAWKERFPNRKHQSLVKAEKMYINPKGYLRKAARKTTDFSKVSGEFTGVMYLTKQGGKKIVSLCEKPPRKFHEAASFKQAGFTDMLQKLTSNGEKIFSVATEGDWAEMDTLDDFGRFVFGTKSQTLERLRPILKNGTILPQISFTVQDWGKNSAKIINKIQNAFNDTHLVVRSSSQQEDSMESSAAGMFTSVLKVERNKKEAVKNAIEKVIKSFGTNASEEDQILVQPQVKNVTMSGVIFTCDIKTGAPYYVLNYDTSGSTDSITAGKAGTHHLHYFYKESELRIKDARVQKLIQCAKELEKLTGSPTIDIEFAINKKGQIFILQTRPIASNHALQNYYAFDVRPCIDYARETIQKRLHAKHHLAGKTTILGDMPDWNPAELIGSCPRPLARSLFEYLISNEAWRKARAILGYFDPAPERLMVTMAGHPYIDVRNSLNSYTPKRLDPLLREKLVNEALSYLKKNPSSHDKLEFEVATTCFTPMFARRIPRWKKSGFTQANITKLEKELRKHTEDIVRGSYFSVKELIEMVKELDKRREKLQKNRSNFSTLDTIKFLLDDCIELGTVPFSSLARMAFMGSTFLRSFREDGAISEESYHGYLNSITTVAGEMGDALEKVMEGSLSLKKFLEEYGHLRPGTYEITSERYDENPDLYFKNISKKNGSSNHTSKKFSWKSGEKDKMQKLLKNSGTDLKLEEILLFAEESIRGRELAKFIFTRNVSDLLTLIMQCGKEHEIDRETLSYLDINQFLILANMPERTSVHEQSHLAAKTAKDEYLVHQQIIMPQIIFSEEDIEFVTFVTSRPNFITSKSVSAEVIDLDRNKHKRIEGKIVLIESADPGYDWIFTHKIAGLVTKYGGAASHMAIRTAEFGLPAAIGVGAQFEQLRQKHTLHLDCANHTIS